VYVDWCHATNTDGDGYANKESGLPITGRDGSDRLIM